MLNIAIVILNWNGKSLLSEFLPSVVKYAAEAKIYVADNASDDDSISFLKNNFPEVNIVINDKNYGFAKGYNEALKHINADIYVLLNSDVEVSENWLNNICQIFEKEENTAVIQPKILNYKNKDYFEYAGAAGGYLDKLGYAYCRGRIFENLEKDLGQYDSEADIFWASGACMCIRKKVFDGVGGFDDSFFAHYEEIDLCWRIKNSGYQIKFAPKSVIYHLGGATLSQGSPFKVYLNFRNSLSVLLKNLPSNQVVPIIFLRFCLDGVAGLQFLLNGKYQSTLAIIKAHFSFYKLIPSTLNKRVKTPVKNYYQTPSIVWSYFIKNKKTFNQL